MFKRISAVWLSEQINTPIPEEIATQVSRLITEGAIKKGNFLPSVTELAKELGVSLGTISAAWQILKKKQIIGGSGRQGIRIINTTVSPIPSRYIDQHEQRNQRVIDLTYSVEDKSLLPSLKQALIHACEVKELNLHQRTDIIDSLKQAVIASWPYPANSFIAAESIFEGLAISIKSALLYNPIIAVEDPTTIGLNDLLNHLDCQIITIPIDCEGPILHYVAKALDKNPAAFIFQPRINSPSGNKTSKKRLKQLAELFNVKKTLIIEQDVLGDFANAPAQSIGQYLPDQTIHIRSYIKAYGPDIGLAVLSAPDKLIRQIQDTRSFTHLGWSSRLLQQALAWLINDPDTQATIRKARRIYQKRYQNLIKALQQKGVTEEIRGDGFGIWLPVGSEKFILLALKEQGIVVMPSHQFCREESGHIRISTSLLEQNNVDYVASAIAKIINPKHNYKYQYSWQ